MEGFAAAGTAVPSVTDIYVDSVSPLVFFVRRCRRPFASQARKIIETLPWEAPSL